MKTTVYKCRSYTDANDKANIAYIQINAAKGIKTDHNAKQIQLTNRHGSIIAVFQY